MLQPGPLDSEYHCYLVRQPIGLSYIDFDETYDEYFRLGFVNWLPFDRKYGREGL